MTAEQRLAEIAKDLGEGGESPVVSVRDFLWWFYAERRGWRIVRDIRSKLSKAGLVTRPDFESAWIDGRIAFALKPKETKEKPKSADPQSDDVVISDSGDGPGTHAVWVAKDATHRISRLEAANQKVVSVKPDETLPKIITRMMAGGYSQVPVMTGERDVKGIISWQTIGSRLALGALSETAKDLSEPHHEITSDRSIFDAIPIIMAYDYVLVRDEQQKIGGIITAADLSIQFRELTEPFLLLSEIENLIRNLIGNKYNSAELIEARESQLGQADDVTIADLSFGEYIRLLQNPDRWAKLSVSVDRVMFCDGLDKVRQVRNNVMHFDPDGITKTELGELRDFTRFLQQLTTIVS